MGGGDGNEKCGKITFFQESFTKTVLPLPSK